MAHRSGAFCQACRLAQVHGYYVFLERSTATFTYVSSQWKVIVVVFLCVTAYLFLVAFAMRKAPKAGGKPAAWWAQSLFVSFLLTIAIPFGVPAAMMTIGLALSPPALMGESYGSVVAQKQAEAFAKGCDVVQPQYQCVEVRREKAPVVKVFSLTAPTHTSRYLTPPTNTARFWSGQG